MKKTKILTLILCLALTLTVLFTACTPSGGGEESTSDKNEANTNENATDIDSSLEIKVSVLNGTTGFGAAKLMNDKKECKSALNYSFTVESDASNINAALINGSVDIAALPTNAAANLYNKTNGGVKILAVNTLGVLYVVTNSETKSISTLSDLEGKTVYCPAQNPTFIFKALCDMNDINVTIDNTYAQPADLRTAVASGAVNIAVLPEPMVTIACSSNDKLTIALDLTAEWDKVNEPGSLAQGCIVARTEFIEEHPLEVTKFLEEYKASVEFTLSNNAEAAEMIVSEGVFTNAVVAQKALPKCNICYVDGEEMKSALDKFFSALFEVAPASVGDKIPDEGIYYITE